MASIAGLAVGAGASMIQGMMQSNAQENALEAQLEAMEFRPFDIQSGVGGATFDVDNQTAQTSLSQPWQIQSNALQGIANQAFGISSVNNRGDLRSGMQAGDLQGNILSGTKNNARNRALASSQLGFDVNKRLFGDLKADGILQQDQNLNARGRGRKIFDPVATGPANIPGLRPSGELPSIQQIIEQEGWELNSDSDIRKAEAKAKFMRDDMKEQMSVAQREWEQQQQNIANGDDPRTFSRLNPSETNGLTRNTGPQSVEQLASSRFDQIMAQISSTRDTEQSRLFDALKSKGILGTQAGANLTGEFRSAQGRQELAAVNQAFNEGIAGAEFEFNRGVQARNLSRSIESTPLQLLGQGAAIGGRAGANDGGVATALGQMGQLSTGNLTGQAIGDFGRQFGGAIHRGDIDFFGGQDTPGENALF